MDFEKLFDISKEASLYGRYITLKDITPLVDKLKDVFQVDVAGMSVKQQPIYRIIAGTGDTKVYIWSQMHGNESTTTKTIFDFLNFLKKGHEFASTLKEHFTFCILPMVNPDGAELYTRENADKVDLNRDAANLSQPESKVLREVFEAFKPHYAYNMHDQRSIFGVGNTGKPATVSFLAPSYNEARDINSNRQAAINVIVAMNTTLQQFIPGQVGRFDDSFNINCIGDMFQSLGVPTVLFEAGHYPNDYIREKTRKFIFIALLSGFKHINENVIVRSASDDYFKIPQNKITFYDFIYKKVKINYENREKITNFASHYKEELIEDNVKLKAYISEIGELADFYGHIEYDCEGAEFSGIDGATIPQVDEKADFTIGLNRKFVNGMEEK
jgi:hypothetical protein